MTNIESFSCKPLAPLIHSHFCVDIFSIATTIMEHNNLVTGIAVPNVLYSSKSISFTQN